jgi:hypothetical protein
VAGSSETEARRSEEALSQEQDLQDRVEESASGRSSGSEGKRGEIGSKKKIGTDILEKGVGESKRWE